MEDALKNVLKEARANRFLARGLNECCLKLDQRKAMLCVLATNCKEANYIKLVETLCSEHQIPLVKVDSNETLGQWAGLCKYDEDANPIKVVKCSVAVVTRWGPETEAQKIIKASHS